MAMPRSWIGCRNYWNGNERAWSNCRARIELLAQFGHELRRPAADYLVMASMSCAPNKGMSNIGCFIFFTDAKLPVLAHALTKEDEVPKGILHARLDAKKQFEANPEASFL